MNVRLGARLMWKWRGESEISSDCRPMGSAAAVVELVAEHRLARAAGPGLDPALVVAQADRPADAPAAAAGHSARRCRPRRRPRRRAGWSRRSRASPAGRPTPRSCRSASPASAAMTCSIISTRASPARSVVRRGVSMRWPMVAANPRAAGQVARGRRQCPCRPPRAGTPRARRVRSSSPTLRPRPGRLSSVGFVSLPSSRRRGILPRSVLGLGRHPASPNVPRDAARCRRHFDCICLFLNRRKGLSCNMLFMLASNGSEQAHSAVARMFASGIPRKFLKTPQEKLANMMQTTHGVRCWS